MWMRALLALIIAGCPLTVRGEQASASVFDSSSGRPISGATVTLSREDGTVVEVETDSAGQAKLPELEPGAYRLHVEKSGYFGATVTLSREDGTVVEFETDSAGQAKLPELEPGAYRLH